MKSRFEERGGAQLVGEELKEKVDSGDFTRYLELGEKMLFFFYRSNISDELAEHLRILPILRRAKKLNLNQETKEKIQKTEKRFQKDEENQRSRDHGYSGGKSKHKKEKKSSKHHSHRKRSSERHGHKRRRHYEDERRRMKWAKDGALVSVKYFRQDDEPQKTQLTEEELKKSKESARAGFPMDLGEELKHREAIIEAQRRRKAKMELNILLDSMEEEILWRTPLRTSISFHFIIVLIGSCHLQGMKEIFIFFENRLPRLENKGV